MCKYRSKNGVILVLDTGIEIASNALGLVSMDFAL